MKERIILAPGANGSELIKSLAMHGVNCFARRICGAGELARLSLMRSGVPVLEDFISNREETALVAEAAKSEEYFINASYKDIKDLARAVRTMRSLVAGEDEEARIADIMSCGDFEQKNSSIVSVYKNYMKLLCERRLVDSISIVRKALAESSFLDAEMYSLKEYPLSPLDKALLDKLSDGKAREICTAALFISDDSEIKPESLKELRSTPTKLANTDNSECSAAPAEHVKTDKIRIKIDSFKECYGAPNEAESIIDDIYRGNVIDKCTVAVTDTSLYGQLFFDLALFYDLPVTFGCGIPITNSNPAKLLVMYQKWINGGIFSGYSLVNMLKSPFFNNSALEKLYPEKPGDLRTAILEILGGLRLNNDKSANEKQLKDFEAAIALEKELKDPSDEKMDESIDKKKRSIPFLKIIAKELTLPIEEFIAKYSHIRKASSTNTDKLLMVLDMASLSAIKEEIGVMRSSGLKQTEEEMILSALRLSVANVSSEEGKLYVTGIDGALTTVRENVYIAGLSASKYPGPVKEDYLLLDTDLEMFETGDNIKHMTSQGKITGKHDRLLSLVRLASFLGSRIHISYSGLNVSELKKDNASSLIYEIFREEHGDNSTSEDLRRHIKKLGYFEPSLSVTRKLGEAYNEGKRILTDHAEGKKKKAMVKWDADKGLSPTALDTFYNCPRQFLLKNMIGLHEPDEHKPFEVIASKDSGKIAHSLMKELGNSDMSLEDFLELTGKYLDIFFASHPPVLEQSAKSARNDFLEMMERAFISDPHREVVFGEEMVSCVHESGVKLHGFPDRVEKLNDDTFQVVDFKTGNTVKHKKDDIESCLQNVMYAYIMEQNGYKISGTEYRYIRQGKTVSCCYDEEKKNELFDKLEEFKKHLKQFDFPIPEAAYKENRKSNDPDPCMYCKYGLVCGKTDTTGGLGDE